MELERTFPPLGRRCSILITSLERAAQRERSVGSNDLSTRSKHINEKQGDVNCEIINTSGPWIKTWGKSSWDTTDSQCVCRLRWVWASTLWTALPQRVVHGEAPPPSSGFYMDGALKQSLLIFAFQIPCQYCAKRAKKNSWSSKECQSGTDL